MILTRPGFVIAVGLAAVLAGCGPASGGEPAFELGTGADDFEAVGEGATLPITEGNQGGIHVWVAGRCRGLGDPLETEFGIRDADSGESLTYLDLRQKVHPDSAGDWEQFAGLAARLRHDDPSIYVGRRVVVWARVTDEDDQVLSDEIEATLE